MTAPMECKITPEALLPNLTRCARVSQSDAGKSLQPAYAFVALTVSGGNLLSFRAQDAHVHYEGRVLLLEPGTDGEALVECDRLVRIMKTRVAGVPVLFKVKDEFLLIRQGEFKAQLPLFREGAHLLPDLKPANFEFELDAAHIAAITRAGSVIEEPPNGFRPTDPFQGVLIDLTKDDRIWINGFSQTLLFCHQFKTVEIPNPGVRFVMSARCLSLFGSLPTTGPVKLAYHGEDQRVVFSAPDYVLYITLVTDLYPEDYTQILRLETMLDGLFPVELKDADGGFAGEAPRVRFTFERAALLDAINGAACILAKEDHCLELRVASKIENSDEYVVELHGVNKITKSDAVEKVLAQADTEFQLRVGVHHGRIREALKAMSTDKAILYMRSSKDLVVLQEQDNPSFVALSVPLRLPDDGVDS